MPKDGLKVRKSQKEIVISSIPQEKNFPISALGRIKKIKTHYYINQGVFGSPGI